MNSRELYSTFSGTFLITLICQPLSTKTVLTMFEEHCVSVISARCGLLSQKRSTLSIRKSPSACQFAASITPCINCHSRQCNCTLFATEARGGQKLQQGFKNKNQE